MIRTLEFSPKDQKHLSRFSAQMFMMPSDDTDYSGIIVNKPWGHEYLAFKNSDVCVWILYIKHGYQTSMHCHPNKYTSLVLLAGEAIFKTLNSRVTLTAPDAIEIPKKVFHSTRALSDPGIIVMETESPTNKKDLLRLEDKYGRQGLGYEGKEHTIPRSPDLYYSFHDEPGGYQEKDKIFGECQVAIKKFATEEEFQKHFPNLEADIVCVLKGALLNPPHTCLLPLGNTASLEQLKQYPTVSILNQETELLLIKRRN